MAVADRLRKARIGRALRRRPAEAASSEPEPPADAEPATPANAEPERPTPLARLWTALKFVGSAWTTLAAIVLNIAGALIFVAAVVLLHRAVTQPTIAISPIAAPEELVKKGFTPEVVAMRLRAALEQIVAEAKSPKKATDITTRMETPDIVLPHTGLSTETIAAQIRDLLDLDNRWSVTGDITADEGRYALNLKITNGKEESASRVETELSHIGDLFTAAARNVLEASDPISLLASFFGSDPDRAMEIARHIVGRYPSNDADVKWAHVLLGNILHARRNFKEASAEYNEALAIDPRFAPAHVSLGNALDSLGKPLLAIDEFKKAIAFDRQYALAHYNLGISLDDRGETDAAIDEFKKAVAINPQFAEAHNNLGNAFIAKRNIDDAIDHYKKAIAIYPQHAGYHYNLGNAFYNKRKLDEAIDEYNKTIAIYPQYADAHNNLGSALNARGDTDKAVAEYNEAIALDPLRASYHRSLAIVFARHGRDAEAKAEFQKASQLEAKPK